MRSILSCLQFGAAHQRSTSQPDSELQSTSGRESVKPLSSEVPSVSSLFNEQLRGEGGDGTILVPRPRRPDTGTLSFWLGYMQMSAALVHDLSSYRSSSSESAGAKSEDCSRAEAPVLCPRKLTRAQRNAKVQKYLEKKKRKNNEKKIRYQYRQELADKRIRHQGRFVKVSEVRDLILKGAQVTVKDKTELNKLLEEDKDAELIAKYNQSVRSRPVFKTTYDPSIVNSLSLGARKSSSSSDSSNSHISPLIKTMRDMDLNSMRSELRAEIDIEAPSILKL